MTDPTQLPPEYLNKLDALKKRYQQADHLADQRKYAEALSAFQHCFQFAAQEHFPLLIEQFMDVWMRIAACHAELNHHDETLKIYHAMEQILQNWVEVVQSGREIDAWMIENNSQVDWGGLLPDGVTFMIPREYDPRATLAAVYGAMGLAYDHLNRLLEAVACYQNAIDGYTQLGNLGRVAQTWKHRAAGCQRRQEWPALAQAAEGVRAAAQSLNDTNGLIDAYAMLFLAAFNQHETIQAIEYLRRAIDLEKGGHPLLMRDQKTLADVLGGLKKLAAPKGAAKPLPATLTQPETWPGLFERVTAQVKPEKGGLHLIFTLHTKRFDEALQLLRAFRVSVIPFGGAQLRALPEPPNFEVPKGASLLMLFTLDDLVPLSPLALLSLSKNQLVQLAQANTLGRGFTLTLDGGSSGGLLAKSRTESWRYDNYLLDWEGWEGVSIFVRTKWGESPEAVESMLESLHNRLKRGAAAGLQTELGRLYRLQDEEASALYWYQQEVRFNLGEAGLAGPGAAHALSQLGTIHKKRRELDTARDYFQLALNLNPNHYEALANHLSQPGELGARLYGLARVYRMRRDEQTLKSALNALCEGHPLAAEELATVVREASPEVDMTAPLSALENPAATVGNLVKAFVESPPPLTHLPPAPEASADEIVDATVARLFSLHDVAHSLTQFAAKHSPQATAMVARPVTIEEMLEYRKDKRGQLTVTNVPGAVLPLSTGPELLIRVTLRGEECTVRLMQEFQLPGTTETGLKSVLSKRLPALAGTLLETLNALVAEGVLVVDADGSQLRYHSSD